jgi:hypothetical protein
MSMLDLQGLTTERESGPNPGHGGGSTLTIGCGWTMFSHLSIVLCH